MLYMIDDTVRLKDGDVVKITGHVSGENPNATTYRVYYFKGPDLHSDWVSDDQIESVVK